MKEEIKNKDNILRMDREFLEDIVVLKVGLEQNLYSLKEIKKYTEDLLESVDDKLIRSGIESLVNIGKGFEKQTNKVMEDLTLDIFNDSDTIIKSLNLLIRLLRGLEMAIVVECITSENGNKFSWMGYEISQSSDENRQYEVLGTEHLKDKYKNQVILLVTLVHHSRELVVITRNKKRGEECVEYERYLRTELYRLVGELMTVLNDEEDNYKAILVIRSNVDKISLGDKPKLHYMRSREISRKAKEILIALEVENNKSTLEKEHTQLFKE